MPIKKNVKRALNHVVGEFWWKQLLQLRKTVKWECSVQLGIWRSRKTIREVKKPFKLQLGCGPFPKEGWLNTDIAETAVTKPDAILDLRRQLPFADESCSVIYSNHVFEHLPYPDVASHVLAEAHRILVPGGLFRVVVPDLDAFLATYHEKKFTGYSEWVLSLDNPSVHLRTRAEVINVFFRQWGEHHFAYDYPTLSALIEKSGFRKVERTEYDPDIDSFKRVESIYLNAYK